MGFLTAAFSSMASNRQLMQLQSRKRQIANALHRAQKDVSRMEKAFAQQRTAAKQQMQNNLNVFQQNYFAKMQSDIAKEYGTSTEDITKNSTTIAGIQAMANAEWTAIKGIYDYQINWIDACFEAEIESKLEALKDYELELTNEKDSIEGQIEFLKEFINKEKEERKEDTKRFFS